MQYFFFYQNEVIKKKLNQKVFPLENKHCFKNFKTLLTSDPLFLKFIL